MPIDYEMLRLIWWTLLGVLLIGFAIADGFDLGVAMCLPWIAKEDMERRILLNSVGPTWEGNQVWFILGGGAIFAAWPPLYSMAFSGFYLAMLVVLLALILRPVGFKYRSKLTHSTWRSAWDYLLFIGGFVPALIFGVAMGNVLQGVPFHFDSNLRPFYTGTFFGLLNPFALLSGLLSVTMLVTQGACFLNIKTQKPLQQRARHTARVMAFLSIVLFALGGWWLNQGHLMGYELSPMMPHDGPSNPLHKQVILNAHAWLANYETYPLARVVPLTAFVGLLAVMFLQALPRIAFVCSSLSLASIIGTVGVSMFPFILPSSSHPAHSLMVWDSSSSQLTLFIMLISTCIFLPMILAYTSWVYYVFRGKVTAQYIQHHDRESY